MAVIPRRVVLALVALSIVGSTAAVVDWGGGGDQGPTAPDPSTLVSPNGTGEYIWPYTSQTRAVTGRTLAVNVVVLGEPERVRRLLVDGSDANWSSVDPNETVEISPWRPTHGAARYSYVTTDPNASGRWIAAAYQLQVGTYFGGRTHIRAYAGPSGEWTALQAHTEYWDWFRVRHTVTGVAPGARFVEHDLRDEPAVTTVTTTQHGPREGGNAGWWTVIGLAPALVIGGRAVRGGVRWTRADVALVGGLLAVVLGVRGWGLGTEALFPAVTPKLFVAVGYPVLAFAPPALVARLAAGRPVERAVALAAAGFGTGLVLDMALVGVRHVPAQVAVHRIVSVAALATIAYGSAGDERRTVVVGTVAWLSALAAPLVGIL